MNQEELLQAMKLRPDILIAIRFLKEAAEHLEQIAQIQDNGRVVNAISDFLKEADKDLKQIRKAGTDLEKFTHTYMLK